MLSRNVLSSVRTNIQKTVLANGCVVVTDSAPTSKVATVGAFVKSGSISERVNGTSSVNRSLTVQGLNLPGAKYESYLHRERTGFLATSLASNAGATAANLVSAINNGGTADLDAAKAHAQQQLNTASGDFKLVTEDYCHMQAYQGGPYSTSPFGTTAGINADAVDHAEFRATNYGAENIVLAGAGGVDHNQLCQAAEKLNGLAEGSPVPLGCQQFTGGSMHDRNDFMRDVWVTLCYQIPGYSNPKALYIGEILKTIFGSWSRGDQHAYWSNSNPVLYFNGNLPTRTMIGAGKRNPYRQSYSTGFDAVFLPYKNTSLFGFYLHVVDGAAAGGESLYDMAQVGAHCRTYDVITPLHNELRRLSKRALTDVEFYGARNKILTEIGIASSDPVQQADYLAREVCMGNEPKGFAQIKGFVNNITKKDVQEMGFHHMYDREFTLGALGFTETVPEYQTIMTRMW